MDDIKDFDVSGSKISSDEIKEYDTGKLYPSYEPNTIKKRRELSLEYKGDKPMFRADGRLYHLIYPHIFPEQKGDNISDFMVKLNERLDLLFRDIIDEYDNVNEARYGTGLSFSCDADGIWAYDLDMPFTGSCEFGIGKVTCWLGEKYSNFFMVELIAKDVKVRRLVNVKSKYEIDKKLRSFIHI